MGINIYTDHQEPLMITCDSGFDDNYLSKKDCIKARLPIL